MREIKFIVWDRHSKRFCSWREATAIFEEHPIMRLGVIHLNNDELSEYTFLQYTGLKDKNGKEIYENDVVSSRTLFGNWKVYWDKEDCGFFLVDNEGYTTCLDSEELEVIGNIYENKELL